MVQRTKGWAVVGFALIGVGSAIYALAFVIAGGLAVALSTPFSLAALVVFGIPALGFLILIAKVIVDRLTNEEDDYYSKNVDR